MTTDIHAAFEAKYKASAQDPACAEELRVFSDGFNAGRTSGTAPAGEALICNKCGYVGTEHHHLRAGKTETCPYVARRFTLSDIWTAEDNKRLSEQLEAIRAANRKHNGILWQRMRAQGDDGPWKVGDEFLPYHPSASHCAPDYRDGWNHCYAAATQARDAEIAALREALVGLVEQLDDGGDQAPGHCHSTPGIWDEDNGAKAGKPCSLCALWTLAKGYAASPQPKPPPRYPSTEGQRIARQIREGKEGKGVRG